jgi:osmotically-inducible protein OsmY
MGQSQRRGPRGWERSDERLKDDICQRLYDRHDLDASDVTIDVREARVTIDGTVRDRWQKHAIEDVADSIPGVKDIENRVRVSRDGEGRSGQSQQYGSQSQGAAGASASRRSEE